MTPARAGIPEGTTFGQYELLRRLATGGMAEIYLARMRGIVGFEKLVVIKRILPHLAEDPDFVQMFLDEARLAATLQHPNIAQVYDVGTFEGTYFFAMEFVHGEDARGVKRAAHKARRPLPLEHALVIVHGMASALRHAHGKKSPDGSPLGVVHRDISPANVLVGYDGTVKLVDFGIAKAALRNTKSRTGTLKGKIPYMSPEQCRGRSVDQRSDLFSLGSVLYELTTGKRPFFSENDLAVLEMIVHQDPTPPSAQRSNYPPELERITLKLMRRDLDERYQTAEELLLDLEAFIRDQRLAVSSIALGQFMHELFAQKIESWKRAEQEGESFGDHVARSITPVSQRSVQLPTPSLPQVELEAEELEELSAEELEGLKAEDPTVVSGVSVSASLPSQSRLRSRRGVGIVVAALVVAAGVAGAAGVVYWLSRGQAGEGKDGEAEQAAKTDPDPGDPAQAEAVGEAPEQSAGAGEGSAEPDSPQRAKDEAAGNEGGGPPRAGARVGEGESDTGSEGAAEPSGSGGTEGAEEAGDRARRTERRSHNRSRASKTRPSDPSARNGTTARSGAASTAGESDEDDRSAEQSAPDESASHDGRSDDEAEHNEEERAWDHDSPFLPR